MNHWMIYGANGYTGALIAKQAKAGGFNPILAGRNEVVIKQLGEELGLSTRVFDLNEPDHLKKQLSDIHLVLNCAGPFSATSRPMINACIESGIHYLDITGEISVFEYAKAQSHRAEASQCVLCPGVGFDVIPTDCVAATLKEALPDACYLVLGFDSNSSLSPGTAKTAVEGLSEGGKVRIDGQIKTVPFAWKTRTIDFGQGEKLATTIPWGDVSTAFYTTGIPNIEVYIPVSERKLGFLKKANAIRWLLGFSFIQNFLKRKVAQKSGPDTEQLKNLVTYVWGEVKNSKGESKSATLTTANGYALTITGSLAVVDYLLNNTVKAGFTTPARLMGSDFISTLPGSSEIVVQ